MGAVENRPVAGSVLDGVVEIMEGVLRRSLSSADEEDFFYLGGRSLTLMVLLARVKKRFGVAVLPKAFMERPTAAGLAGQVEELLRRKAEAAAREAGS